MLRLRRCVQVSGWSATDYTYFTENLTGGFYNSDSEISLPKFKRFSEHIRAVTDMFKFTKVNQRN